MFMRLLQHCNRNETPKGSKCACWLNLAIRWAHRWRSTMFFFSAALDLQGLPALKTAHLKNFSFRNKDNWGLEDCQGRLYRYKSWLRRHLDCCHATMLQQCNLEILDISSVFHWPKEVTTFHGMLLRLHTLACPLHHVYSMVSLTVITLAPPSYWWYLIYLLCSYKCMV